MRFAVYLLAAGLLGAAPTGCVKKGLPARQGAALAPQPSSVNSYHPILLYAGDSGVVLGGSKAGRWVQITDVPMKKGKKAEGDRLDAFEMVTDLVRGTEVFSIYTKRGRWGQARAVGNPVQWVVPSNGETCLEVKLDREFDDKQQEANGSALAVDADWDAMPRRLKQLRDETYAIDVDNDGSEETIRRRDSHVEEQEEGAKVKKLRSKLELLKGNQASLVYDFTETPEYTENYSWFPIDLNGDGDLEIVTADEGHNGQLQVHDGKPGARWSTVFSYYWGD